MINLQQVIDYCIDRGWIIVEDGTELPFPFIAVRYNDDLEFSLYDDGMLMINAGVITTTLVKDGFVQVIDGLLTAIVAAKIEE